MTTVETKQYIKHLTELRDKSINSYEKRMYSKMIKEEEEGICSRCHRKYKQK